MKQIEDVVIQIRKNKDSESLIIKEFEKKVNEVEVNFTRRTKINRLKRALK